MASRRIVCVTTEHPHRHIVSVGIRKKDGSTVIWSVKKVRQRLKKGSVFFTSDSVGKVALVKRDRCDVGGCDVKTIRSHADASTANNLDNLEAC